MMLDERICQQHNNILTKEHKLQMFNHELNLIKDPNIRRFTETVLLELPEYFWTIPASASGKHHPKHALGEGGLVRHTQCAVRIAEALFTINNFTDEEKDLIVTSLLIHDGIKKGYPETKYTVHEHPDLIATFIMTKDALRNIISTERLEIIVDCVRGHMGRWNTNKYSKTVLKTPKTKLERFVHMCDYLASRKFLNMDLEE